MDIGGTGGGRCRDAVRRRFLAVALEKGDQKNNDEDSDQDQVGFLTVLLGHRVLLGE